MTQPAIVPRSNHRSGRFDETTIPRQRLCSSIHRPERGRVGRACLESRVGDSANAWRFRLAARPLALCEVRGGVFPSRACPIDDPPTTTRPARKAQAAMSRPYTRSAKESRSPPLYGRPRTTRASRRRRDPPPRFTVARTRPRRHRGAAARGESSGPRQALSHCRFDGLRKRPDTAWSHVRRLVWNDSSTLGVAVAEGRHALGFVPRARASATPFGLSEAAGSS